MLEIIKIIPQSHCAVLKRLGKFHRICSQGLHFRIPILEQWHRVPEWQNRASKSEFLIELTEQQTNTPPRTCHTKDNVPVQVDAVIYWRIIDVRKALFEVDVLPNAVADIGLNALRALIGKLEFDALLSERQRINAAVASHLSKVAEKWGIQFTRVEVQEIKTSDEANAAMLQQMDAERKRRALVSEAEGKAEAELKIAEAERQATVLRAQGQADALSKIADAEANYLKRLSENIESSQAAQVLVAQKFLEGFEKITNNDANKVFLPNSFNGLFSLPVDQGQKQSN